MNKIKLDRVTGEEWKRFSKQTARRIINNGLGDGRKRHVGDYDHRRLLLKFGQRLPEKQNELRHLWFRMVDEEICKIKKVKC